MSENLVVLNDLSRINELKEYIRVNDYIAYDTETDGTEKDSRIIGMSFSAHTDIAYYIVLRYWDVAQQKLIDTEILKEAKSIVESLIGKALIMHNAVFDCFMTDNNFGVQLINYVHTDTMLMAHIVDENRSVGLKELGAEIFGEDSKQEQKEMKESVTKNGGMLTKNKYELYKADWYLLGRYGAKDAILTIKLFYHLAELLVEQNLDSFFYEEETMPLLRSATYDLNTTGLRVDPQLLEKTKSELEVQCMEDRAFIYKEIHPHVQKKYPGTKESNTFNIDAGQQLSWLLFEVLGNEFQTLTKGGKELCKALGLKIPYSAAAKREFIQVCQEYLGRVYEEAKFNPKTKKMGRPKKVGEYWKYLAVGKEVCKKLATKYKWIATLLEYKKNEKILGTYILGIQEKMKYNIIRPSFLQHGTTSGRYSSKNPNFQNLPRKDKRVKSVIVSRPGKVFVGADYSQLEPRTFASQSQDETLMKCFERGEDFYSVVGAPIFEKVGYSMVKDDDNSFAKKFEDLRDKAKVISLATPYGRTASFTASQMGIDRQEAQELMDKYFENYPKVELMMLESHEMAKKDGVVYNLFGRPRRIPEAKRIGKIYGNVSHSELPYEARTLLNLAMNHRVQSTAASIMNRSAIAFKNTCLAKAKNDPTWDSVKIVMQIHDELVIECPENIAQEVAEELKNSMENTVELPGVKLEAIPKIAKTLSDLK